MKDTQGSRSKQTKKKLGKRARPKRLYSGANNTHGAQDMTPFTQGQRLSEPTRHRLLGILINDEIDQEAQLWAMLDDEGKRFASALASALLDSHYGNMPSKDARRFDRAFKTQDSFKIGRALVALGYLSSGEHIAGDHAARVINFFTPSAHGQAGAAGHVANGEPMDRR